MTGKRYIFYKNVKLGSNMCNDFTFLVNYFYQSSSQKGESKTNTSKGMLNWMSTENSKVRPYTKRRYTQAYQGLQGMF